MLAADDSPRDRAAPDASDLRGFKQLRRIARLLGGLHDSGCARDAAGNRELHFDDYVILVLLYLFNPMIDSMRQLQRVADLAEVQRKLGVRRFSLGSFSESCRVFEPRELQAVIAQLAPRLRPVGRRAAFAGLPHAVELVDGTIIDTLCTVTRAMYVTRVDGSRQHAFRLHLGFEVDRHVPAAHSDVTDARGGGGDSDERAVLRKRLRPGHTYVMDRGYAQFRLFNDIHAIGSSYVCRVRDNTAPAAVREDRPLSDKDRGAGVLSDQVVTLGRRSSASGECGHPVRLVCVRATPHAKRGKYRGGTSGPASDGVLRVATDLLDAPAHVIASLFQSRWTIEVFIRFFKQSLGCRHLLSTKDQGIRIQVYAAVIACMMLNTLTGRKPGKWMLTLMSLYLAGWASEADVLRELARPDNTGAKLKAKDELRKKLGY